MEFDDDDASDGISPLTQQTWRSSGSKHGFFDEDDDIREEHYHSDRNAGKSPSSKYGHLFPTSPGISHGDTKGKTFLHFQVRPTPRCVDE